MLTKIICLLSTTLLLSQCSHKMLPHAVPMELSRDVAKIKSFNWQSFKLLSKMERLIYQNPITPSQINFRLYTLPGPELSVYSQAQGDILITQQFLQKIKNEQFLLAAIAHELGHMNYQHHQKSVYNLSEYYSQECEADLFALKWLKHLKITPKIYLKFLRFLSKAEREPFNTLEYRTALQHRIVALAKN